MRKRNLENARVFGVYLAEADVELMRQRALDESKLYKLRGHTWQDVVRSIIAAKLKTWRNQ